MEHPELDPCPPLHLLEETNVTSSDQSTLPLVDVSNTSSTSSVKVITPPKRKIISVIDVSSSDCSISNYGTSSPISTLTISTKVRMPPSAMKRKRESSDSSWSDFATSSDEEDSYANLDPAKRSRILEDFTKLMKAELTKTVKNRLKTQFRERLRRREAKRKEEAARRVCSVSPIAGPSSPPIPRPPTPFPKHKSVSRVEQQIKQQMVQENEPLPVLSPVTVENTLNLNNYPNINGGAVEGQYVLFVDLGNTPAAHLPTGVYDIVNVAGLRWQEVGLVLDSNLYPLDTAAAAVATTITPVVDTTEPWNPAGQLPATAAAAAAPAVATAAPTASASSATASAASATASAASATASAAPAESAAATATLVAAAAAAAEASTATTTGAVQPVKLEPSTTKQEKSDETMAQLIEAALKEARVIHQATLEAVEAELEAQNIKTF
jgi:hypothetical protein